MYFEEFTAAGALTEDAAEELADLAGHYCSHLTITSNGHSVQALILPVCWRELRVALGSTVTVTAERGYRAAGDEDRLALSAFVRRFQALTVLVRPALPSVRATCTAIPRLRRR
jgi:hypothetical protein